MSLQYLLDTNILSQLVRDPQGRVRDQVMRVGEGQICTSVIVSAEMLFGASKKGSQRLQAQLTAILETVVILPFEAPADRVYGTLRARLERAGTIIGPNDLLIAAHALALGLTLVTDNEREFARVDGLPLENWLRPPPT